MNRRVASMLSVFALAGALGVAPVAARAAELTQATAQGRQDVIAVADDVSQTIEQALLAPGAAGETGGGSTAGEQDVLGTEQEPLADDAATDDAPGAEPSGDDSATDTGEQQPPTDSEQPAEPEVPARVTLYRLYNPYSGEHFYTSDTVEFDTLKGLGWRDEGVAWVSPGASATPVYRLYNPYSGDHHFTTDANEYQSLADSGWRQEGIAWYSEGAAEGTPLYRLYNPYASTGTHHYTSSVTERVRMVSDG